MTTRLDSVEGDLADRIRAASPERQRAAVAAAAEFVIGATGVSGDGVADALNALQSGTADADRQRRLDQLAERLDDEAFDLQDAGRDEEYSARFAQARAVSALAYAFDPDAETAALDGIYEARATAPDGQRDGIIAAAAEQLR
ncbi:hypothetical protein [Microlunatus sp. GCM10028923]|uniref:hypothetical protein n=1 Tax=Microlunatus sp. GCM10028923 TaxID=3273400 RepID=UPI003610E2BD